jgi:hypothetical protein
MSNLSELEQMQLRLTKAECELTELKIAEEKRKVKRDRAWWNCGYSDEFAANFPHIVELERNQRAWEQIAREEQIARLQGGPSQIRMEVGGYSGPFGSWKPLGY